MLGLTPKHWRSGATGTPQN